MNPRLRFLALLGLCAAFLAGVRTHNPLVGLGVAFGVAVTLAPHNRRLSLGVDPAGTHSDGGMVFGSQIVTTTTGGVAYIAEDIQVTDPSSRKERLNEVGVPNGAIYIDQAMTMDCTLQLATATTALPVKYDLLPIKPHPISTSTAISFIISEIGQAFKQDDETKVKVKGYKKYGA